MEGDDKMSYFPVLVCHDSMQEVSTALKPYDELHLEEEPWQLMSRDEAIQLARYGYDMGNESEDECIHEVQSQFGCDLDEAGNLVSRYNRNAKFTYFRIGGHWKNRMKVRPHLILALAMYVNTSGYGDTAFGNEIFPESLGFIRNVITPDGEWHKLGQPEWSQEETDEEDVIEQIKKYLEQFPGKLFTVVDCCSVE